MKDQIVELRKVLKLSQEKFAEKIGLTKNFISLLETGDRLPSDRTVLSICRQFHVNETWLRTGEGEMFVDRTLDDEIMDFIAEISLDDGFKRRFVAALSRLSEEQWELVAEICEQIYEEEKKFRESGQDPEETEGGKDDKV